MRTTLDYELSRHLESGFLNLEESLREAGNEPVKTCFFRGSYRTAECRRAAVEKAVEQELLLLR